MATYAITELKGMAGALMGSVADNQYGVYIGLGYTGSLADMRRKDFLAKLVLVEPQYFSNADLECMYLRTLGYTGSLNDMRVLGGFVKMT